MELTDNEKQLIELIRAMKPRDKLIIVKQTPKENSAEFVIREERQWIFFKR